MTHDSIENALRHSGYLFGWALMGTSIGAWLADHGMALLSAIGIITSIVVQILTYRLQRRDSALKNAWYRTKAREKG
jgi:hypothetical protein